MGTSDPSWYASQHMTPHSASVPKESKVSNTCSYWLQANCPLFVSLRHASHYTHCAIDSFPSYSSSSISLPHAPFQNGPGGEPRAGLDAAEVGGRPPDRALCVSIHPALDLYSSFVCVNPRTGLDWKEQWSMGVTNDHSIMPLHHERSLGLYRDVGRC